MWWLVTISPSGETKPPEPPLVNRTDAFWARVSHASVRSKPYLSLRSCRGGSLTSHIPSSAAADIFRHPRVSRASAKRGVTAEPPRSGQGHCVRPSGVRQAIAGARESFHAVLKAPVG